LSGGSAVQDIGDRLVHFIDPDTRGVFRLPIEPHRTPSGGARIVHPAHLNCRAGFDAQSSVSTNAHTSTSEEDRRHTASLTADLARRSSRCHHHPFTRDQCGQIPTDTPSGVPVGRTWFSATSTA